MLAPEVCHSDKTAVSLFDTTAVLRTNPSFKAPSGAFFIYIGNLWLGWRFSFWCYAADCEAVAPVVATPRVDARAVEAQVVSARTRGSPRRPVVAVRPTKVQVAVDPAIGPAPDKRHRYIMHNTIQITTANGLLYIVV